MLFGSFFQPSFRLTSQFKGPRPAQDRGNVAKTSKSVCLATYFPPPTEVLPPFSLYRFAPMSFQNSSHLEAKISKRCNVNCEHQVLLVLMPTPSISQRAHRSAENPKGRIPQGKVSAVVRILTHIVAVHLYIYIYIDYR